MEILNENILWYSTIWHICFYYEGKLWFSSVQFSRSVMSNSVTLWIAARQASLSITNSRSSPRLTSIESVMPSSHLILCCPLLLLPPIPPSIRAKRKHCPSDTTIPGSYWFPSVLTVLMAQKLPFLLNSVGICDHLSPRWCESSKYSQGTLFNTPLVWFPCFSLLLKH